ncbi:hypothetical protein CHS0354_040210 [Potamilus streckersoni]|uniref:Transmembrane protein 177 n=1 Tax=Potamilus streckersoni TaxID=2493646 RepID=A0AAE0SGP6_9BIVA|nr:hypothetical protein CHS0354_040210 [Potamilus streckersoni]
MAFRGIQFTSDAVQYAIGIGISAVVGTTLYFNTLGISRWRKFHASFNNGKEAELDEDTKKITEEDLVHKGSVALVKGGHIGIPWNFQYKSISEIGNSVQNLSHRPDKKIDWDTKLGQELLQNCILSRNAKKFGIAREMMYVRSWSVHIEVANQSFSSLGYFFTVNFLNEKFKLSTNTKFWFRVIIYSLCGILWSTVYFLIKDRYNWQLDQQADRKAAEISKEVAEGGVEFYDKILKRNMCMRQMLGPEFERKYTARGNEVLGTFRNRHVPIIDRKVYVSHILKSLEGEDLKKETDASKS